jgi:hypothetical protein
MKNSYNRRRLLGSALTGCAAPLWKSHKLHAANGDDISIQRSVERPANPITLENNHSGTRKWMLTNTRIDTATKYRCPWVEGYASRTSVMAGQPLDLMISTQPASDVLVEIFRLGYYGGKGGRKMAQWGPLACSPQVIPEPGEMRLMNCQWEPSLSLVIPNDWISGVYVAKLTEQREQLQSYIIFILRDQRQSDFVFQCSDYTWQAYNRWPSQYSLYDDGQHQWHWGQSAQVSFNRPYGKYCQILDAPLSLGSGEFFLWEFPMAFWMEMEGYDVSYISNSDTHEDPMSPKRGKGFLSIGHDEYWTMEMFGNVESAIKEGINVGFFSGNAVCGKVLWDPAVRAFRRVGVFGPPGGTREFESMSSLLHERPYANELIGAHSTGPVTGGADWVCSLPDHWLYVETGMKMGDRIPGLIGWEFHGDPAPIEGLEIVATGPTETAPGENNGGIYTATVYPGPKGNFVFNAATCWWADGLSAPPGYQSPSVYTTPKGVDSRVRQMTRNVLNRMIAAGG